MDSVPGFAPEGFGKAAADYAVCRKGFPHSFFDRLGREGVSIRGRRILDLGTGTGTLARGFAARGAELTGLDLSPLMIEQAGRLACRQGLRIRLVLARAEETALAPESFDAVTAGQCWNWFDGPATARECRRLLKPGGFMVIAHLDYLSESGGIGGRTEELILDLNPSWPLAGTKDRYSRWKDHLDSCGFEDIRTFTYDEDIPYSHQEWRGRMRTCNGVLALREDAKIADFDRRLAELLSREFPAEPLSVPHRIFVIQGRKP